ncbi:MAG: hypothetical protein SGI77_16580 [Pirellulaceae bacterium]|nr:hypothetical protein [Pirellulaceae bacterium]
MRLRTLLFGLAVFSLTAGSICQLSYSQEDGKQGPPGGQRGGDRGRGGPPGGFSGRGGGGGITSLIRMDEVQTELKLSDEQKKELTAISDRIRQSFSGGGPPGGGPPGGGRPDGGRPDGGRPDGGRPDAGGGRPERGAGSTEQNMKEFQERAAKQVEARDKAEVEIMNILDPDQQDRILGLLIQSEDGRSLQSPSLTDALTLAPDQKAKIKTVSDKLSSDRYALMQKAFGGGQGGPPTGVMEEMEALGKKSNTDLLAVMNAEQKAKFEAMKGEKFTFPESRGFGGGPGGGNRTPGGGGTPGGGRPGRPATPGT